MHDLLDAQQAFGFVVPQFYNIERTIYQVQYPSFDYAAFLPVVTEGNEWARGTLFYSGDIAGEAQWFAGQSDDMPYADVSRTQYSHAYAMAGIGYTWGLEEINVARLEGINLSDDKARAARLVADKFLYGVAMTGDARKNWKGLINQSGVTAGDVPANGTGSVTWWASKTGAQIAADINDALSGIHTGSNTVEMADTVLLPTGAYLQIATQQFSTASDITVLDFVRRNNVYTQETGQPIMIRGLRSLATADPGGDGRGVAYRRSVDVIRLHLPMPHRFLPPFQKTAMSWEVPGILRTGGVEVRRSASIRYFDGILNSH